MMYMVRCGIVRTGGCDGCGAEGARVTAMPEEHADMPRGGKTGGREERERGGLTGGERADGSAR
eukprot:scaffold43211_cov60-Phaeocystis_antarctica.AAC.2